MVKKLSIDTKVNSSQGRPSEEVFIDKLISFPISGEETEAPSRYMVAWNKNGRQTQSEEPPSRQSESSLNQ